MPIFSSDEDSNAGGTPGSSNGYPAGKITVFEPNPSSGNMDKIQTQTTIKGHEIKDFNSSY